MNLNLSSRKIIAAALIFWALVGYNPSLTFHSSIARADKRPAEDRGAMALGQALKRLGVVASVLHTGAHPDDEDSGLLAYLARGRQARTAYLSLTRGDGGQNLIGPELYESLGVIRTEELLAARRLDGASQFFTRAYDFGFSKSRAEALSKWDREAVLADMVRVIRLFRPMVIVSAWSGTPNDGHGHNQAAGLLTVEAFHAAADPSRFPKQIAEGLRPWQAKKLYVRSSDFGEQSRGPQLKLATLSLNTGQYDPLLGRSYSEIATEGRNQHRTQDQDAIERRGPRYSRMRLMENTVGPIADEKDIFDGIDTSITGIARFAGKGGEALSKPLVEAQQHAERSLRQFNPLTPSMVRPEIAAGLEKIREARAMLAGLGLSESEFYDTDFFLKQKEADFADALAKSANVIVDCLADDEIVTPGQTFSIRVERYSDANTGPADVSLLLPRGWTALAQEKKDFLSEGQRITQADFKVTVAPDAEPSQPYWLKQPRRGDMFTAGSGGAGIEPFAPPLIIARVEFEIGGQKIAVMQQAQYRYTAKAQGELRHELKVAPAVSVNVSPEILIFPVSPIALTREITVSLTNNLKQGARGTVKLNGAASWKVSPADAAFDLKREGERAIFTFTVTVPANSAEMRREVSAVATINGQEFRRGYQVVSYSHIEPRLIFRDAETEAEVIDAKVAAGLKVGYIEGAGDDFANALRRLGVDVEVIGQRELESGDLNRFDTIVLGVRVYEVRPDVVANNARLLEYVNRGGTLIVQYNRGNFEQGNYAPYRISKEVKSGEEGPREREREPRIIYLEDSRLADSLKSKNASSMKIGLIGAADDALLKEAQVNAKPIAANELATIDLNQFDAVVIGVGAYKSRPDLIANNERLIEYARRHLVIAEYNKAQYLSGDFSPYPKIDPKPYRVTDEHAKVEILDAAHPLFNFPNKITARDFDGWITERGAYFLSDYDPRYKALLASNDVGEEPKQGGEVVAQYGKGFWIYTAYAWFRQLPHGVPGAYRLVANLVSLPKAPRKQAQK